MKYIVTTQDDGTEEIFVFPRSVDHDCMVEALRGIRDQSWGSWKRVYRKPVSAGFVEGRKCVGMSETLRLSSRPQDTALLKL